MKNLLTLMSCNMFLMAPDTGGGDGASPPTFDLLDWIKRLEAAAKKDRQAIIDELAKALAIPVADAVKMLREAGWDPKKKAPSGEETQENGAPSDQQGKKSGDKKTEGNGTKATISLRHKTPHPRYRRAGLVLTDQFKPFEVTEEQLEKLKKDPWVEIGK